MKNLVKGNFTWIDTFDHEVPSRINMMRDLTVGVFEHLDIKYKIYLYLRIKYTDCILRGSPPKYFLQVLFVHKE